MQRSLMKDSPEPRDKTPFLYAVVVMKGVAESNAASSQRADELMHAFDRIEANGREVEAVRKRGTM